MIPHHFQSFFGPENLSLLPEFFMLSLQSLITPERMPKREAGSFWVSQPSILSTGVISDRATAGAIRTKAPASGRHWGKGSYSYARVWPAIVPCPRTQH